MVGICGLEPQTSSLSVTRSNQLSYIPKAPTYSTKFPLFPQACYNQLMSWEFSIGWFILGILILAAGAAIVVFYHQISYGIASGASSFDRVKLFGIVTCIVGLLIMANLHTALLNWLVSLIFRR